MKKILFTFCLLVSSASLLADGPGILLNLSVGYIDPATTTPDPKSPVVIPSVSLDGHRLYFDTPCDGCTLNIVDGNGVVAYTTVIPTGTTSLVLPATLSGEYELQIIRGNYVFYGTIDLP